MGRNSRVKGRARTLSLCLLAIACGTISTGCDADRTGRGRNNGQAPLPTRIAGTVQANQVSGATVVASKIEANGTVGAVLGQAVTDGSGRYAMPFNAGFEDFTGPVFLTATGGNFTNEGTGQSNSLGATFSAVLPNLQALATTNEVPGEANVTLLTSLAAQMAKQATGGLTQANMTAANSAVNVAFGSTFKILTSPLVDPMSSSTDPVASATADHTIAELPSRRPSIMSAMRSLNC